ncbi:filamin-A isoform X3 [Coturnix japonica]|uniref:filamin-A isoform X3 n=1 Tax=Coturnix japonica TaxID=93934 RepID=UPI00077782BC|nr:filamin-A isoform X3 [Coturnix japonica]
MGPAVGLLPSLPPPLFLPPPPGAMSAAGRAREPEAEMPATEKDLADDAPWKRIQQNTFTRWCNEHLKCVQKRVGNLQTDLGDGLRLIALLEVLSQKKLGRRYNARPTFRQMQLENVSVALDFLERENIKLVSTDSKAIVDGNLKLILAWCGSLSCTSPTLTPLPPL